MAKIKAIMNPISGVRRNREKMVRYISDFFGLKAEKGEFKITSKAGEAVHLAQSAVKDGNDLVIVIGGDGTINEVASGLVGTSVPLGIIPNGSGDGLARSLGIPRGIKEACELIEQRQVFSIDVGKANSRYFFSVAGFGFDAAVGRKFDEFQYRGALSYFYVGAREFMRYHPEKVRITFNNETRELSPLITVCANGQQYGNNAIIAPEAKLDDGRLDICIVHPMNFLYLFDAALKLFNGKLKAFRKAEFYKSDFVVVEREQPGVINIDGEPVFEQARVEITVLPKYLKVIASEKSACLST